MSLLNVGVVVLLLLLTFTRQGSAQGILCSRERGCRNIFNEDSVRDCCVQEGVLTYRLGVEESCERCYVYGWVEDIAPDYRSASPQSVITAEEGETITLHIFYTKNGRHPPAGFRFTIEAGGNATLNEDYTLPGTSFAIFREPTPVNITLLNDGVAGEGLETITLTLHQALGLINESIILRYDTAVIHLRDIDVVHTTTASRCNRDNHTTEVYPGYTAVSKPPSMTSSSPTEVYSGYTAVLFPSTPSSMEEPSEDATLYIYIGLCVAAVVPIVAAVIVISLIVCLRKRQKMVNVADNAAYGASKDRMGLRENIAYGTTTFKGKEDEYEYVSTTVKKDITTTANEAYATTDNVPVVNNQAYGMGHH